MDFAGKSSASYSYGAGMSTENVCKMKNSDNKHSNMFPAPKWNDLWALFLFYVHLAGFIAISVFAYTRYSGLPTDSNPGDDILRGADFSFLGVTLAVSMGTALLLTMLAMVAFKRIPEGMIHFSFIGNIILSSVLAVLAFIKGSILSGIMATLLVVVATLFYLSFRSRIPFSGIILKTVVEVLKEYPAMLAVSAGSVLVTITYTAYFVASLGTLVQLRQQLVEDEFLFNAMIIYSVFSIYWTSQVIENVVQTTIAGVYATFYFLHGSGQAIVNPTAKSLQRSMTYSFGSICFGSLIVATIQTVRFLLQTATDRNSIAGAIVDCILGIIQGLVEYFNYYAYTQIAIYGKPYIAAAKDTWRLVKSRGVDAIVNDNFIGTATGLFALMIGIIGGVLVLIVSLLVFSKEMEVPAITAIVMGLVAMVIPAVAFQILNAGGTTTFVCLAEDPAALQRTKPELYTAIIQKYSQIAL